MNHRTIAPSHQRTVVIGAGIAGLTCAYRFHRAGIPVTLLEQSSYVGGCMRSVHEQGYLLELGPNTFLNSSVELWNLAEEVGLKNLRIETPAKIGKRRYIYKKNKLRAVPAGPKIFLSSVLSLLGRLRLLKEPFIKPLVDSRLSFGVRPHLANAVVNRNPETVTGKGSDPILDESLANFIRRRLGQDVLDNLVTPFVSGIYAGDPERLSTKAVFPRLIDIEQRYGSIFKGMRALKREIKSTGLGSFRAGIGTLPMAIESSLGASMVKNARVIEIDYMSGNYNVRYEIDGEVKNIIAQSVICAVPSYTAAQILSLLDEDMKSELSNIEYAPIVVVHTGYKINDIARKLKGFGFLVPRKQRVRMLGCLWSSSLFPERAPEGHALLTNFIGGMLDKEGCDLTNDDIMRVVQNDLSRALGIKSPPSFACITRYTHAIPQYNIGHARRVSKINAAIENFKGLYLTGSYFTGVSVAGTIEHANRTTDKAIEYMSKYRS